MTLKERFDYNPQTDLLGTGGFSTVFRAYDKETATYVALKFFNSDANKKYNIREELKKVSLLSHPNIVRYHGFISHDTVNFHGLKEEMEVGILELVDGGDLKDYLDRNPDISPDIYKKIFLDILYGLTYLHQNRIIHRDLNAKNILLKKGENGLVTAKITDFGISKALDSSQSQSSQLLGTINFMAPEQFEPAKYGVNGKISTNLDLWSFGVLVYESITRKTLFGTKQTEMNIQETMKKILMDPIPADVHSLPSPFNVLIPLCLVRNANERCQSAEEAIAIMKSPERYGNNVPPRTTDNPAATRVIPKPANAQNNKKENNRNKLIYILAGITFILLTSTGVAWKMGAFGSGEIAGKDSLPQVSTADTIRKDSLTADMALPDSTSLQTPSKPTTAIDKVKNERYFEAKLKGDLALREAKDDRKKGDACRAQNKYDDADANYDDAKRNLDQASMYYYDALAAVPGDAYCTGKLAEIKKAEKALDAAEAENNRLRNTSELSFSFDKTVYNFGTITQGDKVVTEFKITNTSNADITISNALGSCGCTVPEYPKTPIKPGQSGIIKVTFNSTGKKGQQDKTVTVTITNGSDTKTEVLHMKGNVAEQ
jgi:serine/threonine protein kinase